MAGPAAAGLAGAAGRESPSGVEGANRRRLAAGRALPGRLPFRRPGPLARARPLPRAAALPWRPPGPRRGRGATVSQPAERRRGAQPARVAGSPMGLCGSKHRSPCCGATGSVASLARRAAGPIPGPAEWVRDLICRGGGQKTSNPPPQKKQTQTWESEGEGPPARRPSSRPHPRRSSCPGSSLTT